MWSASVCICKCETMTVANKQAAAFISTWNGADVALIAALLDMISRMRSKERRVVQFYGEWLSSPTYGEGVCSAWSGCGDLCPRHRRLFHWANNDLVRAKGQRPLHLNCSLSILNKPFAPANRFLPLFAHPRRRETISYSHLGHHSKLNCVCLMELRIINFWSML